MSWTTEQADDLKQICKQLFQQGITIIEVSYDGSGDDGSVNDVLFMDVDGAVYEKKILNKESICEQVRDACYEILNNMEYDWVNNEGGYGTIQIKTEYGTWQNNYEQRVQEVESHSFSGGL